MSQPSCQHVNISLGFWAGLLSSHPLSFLRIHMAEVLELIAVLLATLGATLGSALGSALGSTLGTTLGTTLGVRL